MRFVRSPVFNASTAAHQNVRELLRCPHCTEGNNINPQLERRAIERYLMKFRTWEAEAAARGKTFVEPSLARQRAADAAQNDEQRAYETGQQERRKTRQRKAITRSREIEAHRGETPQQPPADMWQSLHSVVTSFRKPRQERA